MGNIFVTGRTTARRGISSAESTWLDETLVEGSRDKIENVAFVCQEIYFGPGEVFRIRSLNLGISPRSHPKAYIECWLVAPSSGASNSARRKFAAIWGGMLLNAALGNSFVTKYLVHCLYP
jgi:hypothetical protein